MNGSPILLLCSALAIALLLAPALAVFFGGIPDRPRALTLGLAILASLALAAAEWMLFGASPGVAIFQGSLACVSVAALLSIGLRNGRIPGYCVFAGCWAALVLVPVGFSLFDIERGPLFVLFGTLDFGGVGVVALSTGTAALGIAIATRSRQPRAIAPPVRNAPVFVICAIAGVVGWGAVAAGAELVVDSTTLVVLENELWAAGAGLVGWTVAQLVNVHRPTVAGLVAGIFAGSVAVLAASPWLSTTAVVVLGIGAGILGHVTAVACRHGRLTDWATLIGVLLVPGALGMVAAGIIATGTGLIFSGQTTLLVSQFIGLAIVLVYSLLVATVLALVFRSALKPESL